MEVDKKAAVDLSTASSTRTTMIKMLATMMKLREESANRPANVAFS
jgi:hypothetical protein